jgi:hypothetical protein
MAAQFVARKSFIRNGSKVFVSIADRKAMSARARENYVQTK